MASAADNFNRANASLNGSTASDGVHVWTTRIGAWNVVSNQADPDTTANGHATISPGTAEVDVAATVAAGVGPNPAGVVLRWSDIDNYLVAEILTGSIRLRKREAGTFTNVATASITAANGDRIRARAVGDQVSVYHTPSGGSESLAIAAQTVAFNQTAAVHGIFASSQTTFKIDDFAVTDLAAAGSIVPLIVHHRKMQGMQ